MLLICAFFVVFRSGFQNGHDTNHRFFLERWCLTKFSSLHTMEDVLKNCFEEFSHHFTQSQKWNERNNVNYFVNVIFFLHPAKSDSYSDCFEIFQQTHCLWAALETTMQRIKEAMEVLSLSIIGFMPTFSSLPTRLLCVSNKGAQPPMFSVELLL